MDEMNYNEQVLKAVQIVVLGEIKKIHFDQTIKATIIGDEAADEGRYWCSNGYSEFWAYSTEVRYRANDKVLVTIPEGDYSNTTKVIISKLADENNSPLILASPLSMMVDLTNNMITGEVEEATWANYGRYNLNDLKECYYSWDKDTKDFISSSAFQYGTPFYDSGINKIYETDITRLGFSALFSTWLTEYATISGNYGIAIELTFKDNDREGVVERYTLLQSIPVANEIYYKMDGQNAVLLSAEERAALFDIFTTDAKRRAGIIFYTEGENKGKPTGSYVLNGNTVNVYRYAPSNEFLKYITFDSDEFFGDVYGYDTYYTNETVFDLSEFSKYAIIRIRAWLYLRDNFRTMDSDYVEAPHVGDFSNINPNIFMKDPYLCLGVEVSEFTSDRAELITSSSSTFYKTEKANLNRTEDNLKTIHLRWIHKDENTGIIRVVESDEYPEDYEVRWYRWALGLPSCDEFSGAHWERFYGCKDSPNKDGDFAITALERAQLNGWTRDPTNTLDATLSPNVNRSQEKIKAVILKVENPVITTYVQDATNDEITSTLNFGEPIYRFAAETKELTFINDDEVRNEQTYVDVNALSIRFDDGSNGHYFIYNRAGNVSKDSDLEIRTLTLVFDESNTEQDVYKKPTVPSSVPITWHFPESATMITPATSAGLDGKPASVYTFSNTVSVGYFVKKSLSRLDNNNTVTAEATIDGVTYSAMVQMSFGTAGTSGSDYTLDIVWNDNALDVTNPTQGLLIGEVGLFDSAGNLILGDNDTITDLTSDYELKYEWEVAELIDDDAGYDYPYEEYGVLYPIYRDYSYATFDLEHELVTGVSDDDTYGGYYYFILSRQTLADRFNSMCGKEVFSGNSIDEEVLNNNKDAIISNLSKSSDSLAFYDPDLEKFIYIKDYFLDINHLTSSEIADVIWKQLLYRRRDVENLRVVKTIKNEKFYKDLIDVFVVDGNLLYTNLLANKTIADILNLIDEYDLRVKSALEIGASAFNNFYFNKTVTVEEVVEENESDPVTLTTTDTVKIPYSLYLQELFEENISKETFADRVVAIDNSKTVLKNGEVYLSFNNLSASIKESFYEELFNALFETNNFYYNYLNKTNFNCKSPSNIVLTENSGQDENEIDKYFYAQKINKQLLYIFLYIASGSTATEIKTRLKSASFFGKPGDELYICSKMVKNNNLIKDELILTDSDYKFNYEWPKPKFDYKVIENIEGKEEDDDEFAPEIFVADDKSKVWKIKGTFITKTEDFYKELAGCIFENESIQSLNALTNRINTLKSFASDIDTRSSGESVDDNLQYAPKGTNDYTSLVYTLRPDEENLVEDILSRLAGLKGNGGNNWITSLYDWKYGSNEVSGYNLYIYLWKALFSVPSEEALLDAILVAINNATSPLTADTSYLNTTNPLLAEYFKISNNNDITSLESVYHYLTTGVNSRDKLRELYEWVKNNFSSLKTYEKKSLNDLLFEDSSNSLNFYRTLAKYCGIYDSLFEGNETQDFASDKLTFYSAFNYSIPIGSNSNLEKSKFISNLFCTNDDGDTYYRLADYLNLDSIGLANALNLYSNGEWNNCLIEDTSGTTFDFDQLLVAFLNAIFDSDKSALNPEEKHSLILTIFSATTSSAINNYVVNQVINEKDSVAGNSTITNKFIFLTGTLSLNKTAGTVETYKAFGEAIGLIKSAASSSYLNYFTSVNNIYRQGYNVGSWYNIIENSNSKKWRLLFLLLCSLTNFPTTEDGVYSYVYDSTLTLGSDTIKNLCNDNNSSTPLYLLSSASQSSMPTSLYSSYDSNSTYQSLITNITNSTLNGIYIYSGLEDSTYKFTYIGSKSNYLKILKTNLFRASISETSRINVSSENLNATFDLGATSQEALCKYMILSGNYIDHLNTDRNTLGTFRDITGTPLNISNYSDIKLSIPFINYSTDTNSYDNILDYLSKSISVSGSTATISDKLVKDLANKLDTGIMVLVEETTPNKTVYINKCFELLINSAQNTNNETILSESLASLDSFKTAFLSSWDTIDERDKGLVTISDFLEEVSYTNKAYLLENESTGAYKNIFESLKNILDAENKNPVNYSDDSLALKGWQERMYEAVKSFYNNFDTEGIILLTNPDSEETYDFYAQIYSTYFGVSTSSADKIYTYDDDSYFYSNTNKTRGPEKNYILLLTRYVSNIVMPTSDSNELLLLSLISKKSLSSTDLPGANLVYINGSICLNNLLKKSNNQVTNASLKTVFLYLENATNYYSSISPQMVEISKEDAYKNIFNTVLSLNNTYMNDDEVTWKYFLNLFNINNNTITDQTAAVTHNAAQTSNLFVLYYYGNLVKIDSSENFLYNLDTELGKCFDNSGKFTDTGKALFFDILSTLENSNNYIYKLNSNDGSFDASAIMLECQSLWNVSSVSNDSLIETCLNKINNTLAAYRGFMVNYKSRISLSFGNYDGRYNGTTKPLADWFNGNTINELEESFATLKNNSFILLEHDSEINNSNGENVFNYLNTNNFKPFIKINDNFIVDPYYKDSSNLSDYKGYRTDETYYYPQQRGKESGKTIPLVYSPKGDKGRIVWISPNLSLAVDDNGVEKLMSSLSVLKVTLSNFGDYDLVAYFPIAVKQGTKRYSDLSIKFTPGYLQGATYIRYTSFGETDFEKNPYRMFSKELNEVDGKHTEVSYPDLRLLKNPAPAKFGWKIIHPTPEIGVSANFIPTLKESLGITIPAGTNLFLLPILQPITVYIPEAVPYGVSCYYLRNLEGSSTIPIWTLPVYCYEDNYPSTTINKWDGKTIVTDEESGTIISSAIAAGKKESDNTFTGVMMGDWSRSDTDPAIAAHTGLFGFNHGSMSYAFKDDGTGFIGKDGRGRIIFDGNKSLIYSNNWKGKDQCGMFLDIDDGVIKLLSEVNAVDSYYTPEKKSNGEPVEKEAAQGLRYITLSSKATTYPLAIGLENSPSSRKFRVKWNGSVYMQNAYLEDVYAKGYIYALGGTFYGDITSEHGTIYGPEIIGTKITGADITCDRLTANELGMIAGWTITKYGLVNADKSTLLFGEVKDITLEDGTEINNPYGVGIITNRLAIRTDIGLTAELGYLTGRGYNWHTGESFGTNALGMASDNSKLIFYAKNNDAAIRSGTLAFLEGGYSSSSILALIAVNATTAAYGPNLIILKANGGIVFEGVPADKQYGIYARFA